ncbi:MAG: DUF1700 domain-containing protein [Clostridia bacterium]|nr:DUF1700 domain-containing protein [Clostridia bacterium]
MNKQEFLFELEKALEGLPQEDINDRIEFYGEMIDDLMEEGLPENEALERIGNANEIATDIISETPITKIIKERVKKKRRMRAWEIVLLSLGSPIWLSLGIAFFAVIFSLYVSLWAVVISLWSVFVSFAASSFSLLFGGVVHIITANTPSAICLIATALVCAGLAIFSFYGCLAATKGSAILGQKTVFWIKNCFIKKEAEK